MSGHTLQWIRATVRKALWVAAPAAVVGVLCVATAEEPTSGCERGWELRRDLRSFRGRPTV